MLVGGSYLDLASIFDVHELSIFQIFDDVVQNWFCDDSIANVSMEYLI